MGHNSDLSRVKFDFVVILPSLLYTYHAVVLILQPCPRYVDGLHGERRAHLRLRTGRPKSLLIGLRLGRRRDPSPVCIYDYIVYRISGCIYCWWCMCMYIRVCIGKVEHHTLSIHHVHISYTHISCYYTHIIQTLYTNSNAYLFRG